MPKPRPIRADENFDAATANVEMVNKLRGNALRRRARAKGFELRHSDYGFSLIDADRKRVDSRNDLTLDEVAKRLDAS